MFNFTYHSPTKIIFGTGERATLAQELGGRYNNVLLIVSKGPFHENGVVEELKRILLDGKLNIFEMSDIDSNPLISSCDEGVRVCVEHNIDCIIALGGGSALDCAKTVGAAAKTGVSPLDLVFGENNFAEHSIDVVTIPTIAATGTEVNPYAVVVNDETKEKFYCVTPHPVLAVLDPELTLTVPIKLTVFGAMDILSHTFEFYFNGFRGSEIQTRLSEAIIISTMHCVETLVKNPGDITARGDLMWLAVMAWGGLTKIGRGDADMACHGLEESFSGFFKTHHGGCLGVLTPRWMERVYKRDVKMFADFAVNVLGYERGEVEQTAELGIKKYKEWLKSVGAPNILDDLGERDFSDENLLHVATTACKIYGGSVGSRIPLTLDESFELLKSCRIPY